MRPSHLAAALVGGGLVAISIGLSLSYWPGLMTWDSIRQYDQALSGRFDDWHPPLMEWAWRQLAQVRAGPAPMLVLQLGLYGAGYGLLVGWALNRRRPGLAVALGTASLTPIAVALMGAVIKDSLMAALLLAAAGLLAWRPERGGRLLRLTAISLIVLASAIRFNAFLAGGPLLTALLPERLRSTRLTLAATAVAATAALLLPMPIANHLLGAQRSGVELSLVIFDLGGITEHSGEDAFPPLPVSDPVRANHSCYSPVRWDLYADWAEETCPVGFDAVGAAFREQRIRPTLFWAEAILAHPLAYAQHRLRHFNINARFLVRGEIERPVHDRSEENVWSYQVTPNLLLHAVDAMARLTARTPLGWPIFWMAVALGVLTLCHRLPSRSLVVPLALSALLYGLGYGVVGVSSELRYHLWTMIAALVASCIAAADMASPKVDVGRTACLIAALPPVLVVALGAAWRLTG